MEAEQKARLIAQMIEEAKKGEPVPESVIREARGNRSQHEIALKAGITQAHLSLLESGQRDLTEDVAQRLAPLLGLTPDGLRRAEAVAQLKRAALKGSLEPRLLLETIEDLAASLPDNEISEALVTALLEVLGTALQTYDQSTAAAQEVQVAAKSKEDRGTRSTMGIQRRKRYQPPRGR